MCIFCSASVALFLGVEVFLLVWGYGVVITVDLGFQGRRIRTRWCRSR